MRFWLLLLAFLGASGAAVAGDDIQSEMRIYDSSDYAGMAYYRMDFGSTNQAALRHTVGFRMDNERAFHNGRPALLKAELDSAGSSDVRMNGVSLSAIRLAAQQRSGGMFSNMTVADIVTASIAGVILLVGTASALDSEDDEEPAAGTGGTGAN